MQKLPIGIQSFPKLRETGCLYVDKTARLQELAENGQWYFLARPRRFGKSLTISVLEAMLSGRTELFKGLSAEKWVEKQAEKPCFVLRFDMSGTLSGSSEMLETSLRETLARMARRCQVTLYSTTLSGMLLDLIEGLYEKNKRIAVLIDEYDKPILDNLADAAKAAELRRTLHSFYTTVKSCDEYLSFVFITGISKFSKVGVFSAMNNLLDISLLDKYGDLLGYTQEELETCFSEWIDYTAEKLRLRRQDLLERLRSYYDGFSFDGKTKLYNPFSILSFFAAAEFKNYWYESGSPSFIIEWLKKHQIKEPEEYRHLVVKNDFLSSQEIELADPASFLFQSGYLTVEKTEEQLLTLDYPNREVLDSLSGMYLNLVYKVDGYTLLGNDIWKALRRGCTAEVVRLFNTALAGIPYDDYRRHRDEYWYRSMFIMLLRGAGIIAYSEPHTSKERADVVLQFDNLTAVLEFKYAGRSAEVEQKLSEGLRQLRNREYAKSYALGGRRVIAAVIAADGEKRQTVFAEL